MADWWTSTQIKVTPEELIRKAGELQGKITKIQKEFDSLEQNVNHTVSYWIGEAGDTYRNKYKEFKPGVQEIIRRLEEHVQDLNAMAGVYQKTESEVKEVIEELPSDVIV